MNDAATVVLVTGASSGIGRATAELLARRGMCVAAVARNAELGLETVQRIRAAGGTAEFIQADMEREEQIATIVPKTLQLFGRLDIAFNNAGMIGVATELHLQPSEVWARVIATNLTAVFLCMQHEIAHMLTVGRGVIVNTASGAGVMPQPMLSPYCVSKHGVIGLTKTAAREYATRGIRVNAVCPGLIRTPQLERYLRENAVDEKAMIATLPSGRIGTPEEVAAAVGWLSSPDATYVSGECLFIDGALACR